MLKHEAVATIAILTTGVFATTIVITLADKAEATDYGTSNCSPRNPQVCTHSGEGGNTATTTNPNLLGNSAFSVAGGGCVIKNGHFYGTNSA